MNEFDLEEWEKIAILKEKEREQQIREIERLEYLASIPFHKRLQEKGEEERLERFKKISEEAWKKKKIKLDFNDYWSVFLDKGISINEYLEVNNG